MAERSDDGADHRRRRHGHRRRGRAQRVGATDRCAPRVILATGGFDHDLQWRRRYLPVLEKDWSFGNPLATGDGIRAGEKVGGSTELLDEAWWFPAIQWPDGRLQFMLNERMMPSQFVVNGMGKRFVNEAAPYMDFAHAMIEGQRSGVSHIPCWLITDIRSFHRYVIAGHLPIPKVPFAPVPPAGRCPEHGCNPGLSMRATAGRNSPARSMCPPRRCGAPPSGSTSWRAGP
ncbi:FAD binding domain protein [Mycobacterium xenopi 4042]|uniref:FAD binding domain protein n=1 Tax=Mycobacterium xenopi 4042 TaxID=1299334 RepID=X8AFY5_MYCXE|nr:FAD binding domain protein [Mycobacterium xenopi 4042]